jgi:uncharacterized membrane protein YesL
MDTFTFLIAVVVMMLAVQYNMGWLIFGIAILLILSMRSFSAIILMLIAVGTIYFLQGDIKELSPFIMFGLVLISLLLESKKKPEQPDMYGADLGGLGGFGGMGGGMEGY